MTATVNPSQCPQSQHVVCGGTQNAACGRWHRQAHTSTVRRAMLAGLTPFASRVGSRYAILCACDRVLAHVIRLTHRVGG